MPSSVFSVGCAVCIWLHLMVGLVVGAHQLTSPPSQSESLLAMFDPLSSHDGKLVARTFGLLS